MNPTANTAKDGSQLTHIRPHRALVMIKLGECIRGQEGAHGHRT